MLEPEPPRPLPRQAPLSRIEAAARRSGALFLAALVFGGCATAAEVTGTATQQDLLQIRTELAELQRARTQADGVAAQFDRRLREQTAEAERRTAAISQRLDALATTLSALSSRLDELSGRVDALGRQLRTALPRAAPGPSAPAAPGPSTPAPPPPARPTTGSLQPPDVYQAAYIDFSKGSYSLAIAGFREFLRRYPEHELAGNSQYWIGEAHFSLARGFMNAGQQDRAVQSLEQAVQEFKKVVANYPRGDKAPTALYKEALALIELKQPALAQGRLQYLIDNFPQAEETPLARERLSSLRAR